MSSHLCDRPALSATALAIDGGTPACKGPFGPWPYYSEEEISIAASILRSGKVNYWTGEQGRQFEKEFADFCGAKYGVAVANGSVALELALYALGIGPGNEVIVPSRSFIASASCALVRGAIPVFADVDLYSQNINVDSIREVKTQRTKAIIVVHLAGWPCDMDSIMDFAYQNSLFVVEDCAQAHGATYKGRRVGSFGDVAAFSFCQDKIVSTGGEGGMVLSNNPTLWQRAWSYKDHGRDHDLSQTRTGARFRWIHTTVGTNFRLTETQSAIGRIQLRNIGYQLDARRRHASALNEAFAHIPGLRTTIPSAEIGHAYYKYYAFVEPQSLRPGWNRERILASICAEGIPCSMGSCSEIYRESAFHEELHPPKRRKNARFLGDTSLMFLVHPTLTAQNIQDTCLAVSKVMHAAVKEDYLRAAA
jgi:dTDP-4-amino-4,6-dideoxygalactose transaminase